MVMFLSSSFLKRTVCKIQKYIIYSGLCGLLPLVNINIQKEIKLTLLEKIQLVESKEYTITGKSLEHLFTHNAHQWFSLLYLFHTSTDLQENIWQLRYGIGCTSREKLTQVLLF